MAVAQPVFYLFIYVVFSVIPDAESSTWPTVDVFVEYKVFLKVKLLETASSSGYTSCVRTPGSIASVTRMGRLCLQWV